MDATAFCSNHVWKRWFWPQKLSMNAPRFESAFWNAVYSKSAFWNAVYSKISMDATAFCSNHVWKRWFWPQKLSINAPLDNLLSKRWQWEKGRVEHLKISKRQLTYAQIIHLKVSKKIRVWCKQLLATEIFITPRIICMPIDKVIKCILLNCDSRTFYYRLLISEFFLGLCMANGTFCYLVSIIAVAKQTWWLS